MIGTILAGRYRIAERIGGGGMALVYRAEDMQLGRDVAVKVLRGQFGSDEEFIRRFRREAQNAASLSHPNVVQIYDVGQEDDHYFIVMELVEGKTLKAHITDHGPVPPAEAARIAAEILSALGHAHENRIVHRDIKPHNILLSKDGRVKVTDFGIARATTTDTVTHTGTIMGSAHYFSPEQANGQPTGDKSDIYSLGVVLYEMVTGTVPFQGESPITVALKHIREQPLPPSHRNDEVPVELESLILRALEKEPEDRFASAAEMRQALEQFRLDYAAGKTHIASGDFPTMAVDIRAMKNRKARRTIDDEDEAEAAGDLPDGQPKRKSRVWIWVAAIALLVLGGIGVGVWAMIGLLEVPTVNVPDIVGMPVTEAQNVLEEYKILPKVEATEFSTDYPANHVTRTIPEAGTPVKQGRTIQIFLSKGAEEQQLQDVTGMTEEQARASLESSRLAIADEVKRKNDPAPEGQVIDQSPRPGTRVKPGDKVTLTVSLGPLRVPQIVGVTVQQAQQMLGAAGLKMGVPTPVPDAAPKDTVVASDPAPGQAVVAGQTVNVSVSTGAGPVPGPGGGNQNGQSFEKEVTLPGDAGKTYEFRIILVDVVSNVPTQQAVFAGRRKGGERVTVRGTFYGDASLFIVRDGVEQGRIPLP